MQAKHLNLQNIRLKRLLLFVLCVTVLALGCNKTPQRSAEPKAHYAVTTSWLECCLRDLLGPNLPVVRVCPPGSCPGHFDLSPGSLTDLKYCRTLFLFDFQQAMDDKLAGLKEAGVRLSPIKAPEGLCVPASYLAGCQAVRDALVQTEPDKKTALDAALVRTHERLEDLEREIRGRIKATGLNGAQVVTSGHQAEFCHWLDLKPVAAYSGGDAATPAQLESLIKQGKQAGVRFVIANQQEGRQVGEALAWQLGAKLVVFSNFPMMNAGESSFDALVRGNVANLIAAAEMKP